MKNPNKKTMFLAFGLIGLAMLALIFTMAIPGFDTVDLDDVVMISGETITIDDLLASEQIDTDVTTLHILLNDYTECGLYIYITQNWDGSTPIDSLNIEVHRERYSPENRISTIVTSQKVYYLYIHTTPCEDSIDIADGGDYQVAVDTLVIDMGGGDDRFGGYHNFATAILTNVKTSIYGSYGDDTIDIGFGDVIVDGGDGDDTIRGMGATLYPLDYSPKNILIGGPGNDTLGAGFGGYYLIYGGDGDDSITGAPANNTSQVTAIGGAGNDDLHGLALDDTLLGDEGNDTLRGEWGDDILDGGPGNDTIYGGSGKDALLGKDGVDTLRGEGGEDMLWGGPGRDSLYGGAGADTFFPESGDAVRSY